MAEERPTTTFNIGSQNARLVNNVGGNQYNEAGAGPEEMIRRVQRALSQAGLSEGARVEASQHLDAVLDELTHQKPRKAAIAERIGHLTKLLVSAGAVVSAGTALGGPLAALAAGLGALVVLRRITVMEFEV